MECYYSGTGAKVEKILNRYRQIPCFLEDVRGCEWIHVKYFSLDFFLSDLSSLSL